LKNKLAIFLFCFFAFFIMVTAVYIIRIHYLNRSKLTSFIITGSAKKIIISGSGVNMDQNKDNQTIIFEGDYDSLHEALTKKYNGMLTETADKFNDDYKKRIIKLLGEKFKGLVHARVLLLKNFEIQADKITSECGISKTNDKVQALNDWFNQKNHDIKKGKQLFSEIIDEVEKINPELGKRARKIESDLASNQVEIEQYFKSYGNDVKAIESEIKSEMQKIVLKLMLDYNVELKALRKQFDLPPMSFENPFKIAPQSKTAQTDIVEQVANDQEDIFDDEEVFIDVSSNKNDLN